MKIAGKMCIYTNDSSNDRGVVARGSDVTVLRPSTDTDTIFMAIYLPSTAEEEQLALDELTPREIVAELDKHVIGQKDAKRAVAIALRNRIAAKSSRPNWPKKSSPRTF